MTRVVRLLLALLLVGCATAPPPPPVDRPVPFECVLRRGPTWIELTSPNFVMRTTKPEQIARVDIQAMEDLLLGIRGAVDDLLPAAPTPSRTSVVFLTEPWEIRHVMPPGDEGFAIPSDDHGRPTIVIATGTSPLVFRHEFTHRLTQQRLPRAAPWLSEGLAEYFQMTTLEQGVLHLGSPTPRVGRLTNSGFEKSQKPRLLLVDSMPTLATLMAASHETVESDETYYIAGWAAVHYLANGRPYYADRFRRFLRAIAEGAAPAEALVANYGALDVLEARYHQYLRYLSSYSHKALQRTIPLATRPTVFTPVVRTLTDGEVHRFWTFFQPARAEAELEHAQRHDPQSPSTRLIEFMSYVKQKRYYSALASLDDAVARPPREPYLLAVRLTLRLLLEEQKPAALRDFAPLVADARELAATDETNTLLAAAKYGALSGDLAIGLPAAERAVSLDPYCFDCLAALAQLRYLKGDFKAAVDEADLAIARCAQHGGPPWAWLDRVLCYRRRANGQDVDCSN